MQMTSRKTRRTSLRADAPLTAPSFGSPIAANLFYALCGPFPTIGWRVRDDKGTEYQINLTDDDIRAINSARYIAYAGPEYDWPEAQPIANPGYVPLPLFRFEHTDDCPARIVGASHGRPIGCQCPAHVIADTGRPAAALPRRDPPRDALTDHETHCAVNGPIYGSTPHCDCAFGRQFR